MLDYMLKMTKKTASSLRYPPLTIALIPPLVFGLLFLSEHFGDTEKTTALLVAFAYVFLTSLFWALCLRPLFSHRSVLSKAAIIIMGLGHLFVTAFVALYYLNIGAQPTFDIVYFIITSIFQGAKHLVQTSGSTALRFSAFIAASLLGIVLISRKAAPVRGKQQGALFFITGLVCYGALNAYVLTPPHNLLDAAPDKGNKRILTARKIPRLSTYQLPDGSAKHDVIVILIESMRYDLLTDYPEAIPNMAKLAKKSIVFERSYASASHSNLEDLSVWYASYPVRSKGWFYYRPDDRNRPISTFEIYKNLGYTTGYISSQNEKWGNMINWLDVPEVDHFIHSESVEADTWYNERDKAGVAKLIRANVASAGKLYDQTTFALVKQWLKDNKDDPTFLGVNLQNTHFNYVVPKGGPTPFTPYAEEFEAIYFRWPAELKPLLFNRYLNAFYNLDLLVGELIDFLKANGMWDTCYFVIVGDSGEGFHEHGFGNHSGPMYEEVMRTYTIIKTPDSTARNIAAPLSHIDVIPTVLDLQGVTGEVPLQGISVFDVHHNRPIFFHACSIVSQYGVLYWPWKYLYTIYPEKTQELYNLDEDPHERVNLTENNDRMQYFHQLTREWAFSQMNYYDSPDQYLPSVPYRYHLNKSETSVVTEGNPAPAADMVKVDNQAPPS